MTAFTDFVDVAAERLGGRVLLANDEFFASKENLLKPASPVWKEGEYSDRGKWMDGWETRRRRTPGHDWCLIRLGCRAIVRGVVVNTAFFTGNYPPECSIDACLLDHEPDNPARLAAGDGIGWKELLPRSPLRGDCENSLPVASHEPVSHLRLNIYPDGGVARLRVYGDPVPDPALQPGVMADLAALRNGGMVVACSDMLYGARNNLILPGHSTYMGEGWETRRRRGPGNDWTIVRLARRGLLETIEVDTDHYKGNAPASCSLDVCDAAGMAPERLAGDARWVTVLQEIPLEPDTRHLFPCQTLTPATHARLNIYPDGGVARLRLLGKVAS
jgi:allantoicase